MEREIVVLIGSTRFKDSFEEEAWRLTSKGYIVWLPNFRPSSMMAKDFDIPEEDLEDIGFRKIDKADHVYVINEDGYVGSSTQKEIDHATEIGKPISYMEGVKLI